MYIAGVMALTEESAQKAADALQSSGYVIDILEIDGNERSVGSRNSGR